MGRWAIIEKKKKNFWKAISFMAAKGCLEVAAHREVSSMGSARAVPSSKGERT